MKPEQWRKIDDALRYAWGRVELLIDGYTVVLGVAELRPRRYVIVVYVNGYFRGKFVETRGYYWSSVDALKRHFIANNKSIELVEKPLELRA